MPENANSYQLQTQGKGSNLKSYVFGVISFLEFGCRSGWIEKTLIARPGIEPASCLAKGRVREPETPWQACAAHKQARGAEISVGVGDPQSHTTVCGGCVGARCTRQGAKRSSGFPRGKHLTNPADRSRGPVRDRQPSQRCDQNQ